jgi:hypothetical protein
VLLEKSDGVSHKFDHWRKYLLQMYKDNLKTIEVTANDCFPRIKIFSLCYLAGDISSN